jgi:sensor histidine kinase YesM
MKSNTSWLNNKSGWIETVFFLCYFLLFPLLSDIEFNLREPGGNYLLVFQSIPYRILSGLLYMVPYLIYYKFILQKHLFQKHFIQFTIYLLLFLFLFNIYTPLINWFVAELNFSKVNLKSAQGINFQNTISLNFSLMYIFRELLVITALAYFIRSKKQEKQLRELKEQQLNAELNYLKIQLQPHFFFNTLNNIYSLTLQGSEKAAPLIAKHSDIMRYILYEASKPKLKLKQEIDFLKTYTEVEAIRYSDKIRITFESQGINETARIEPLLLLPFIENTFKHGIREEISEGYIHIIISLVENELSAEIRNSKISDQAKKSASKGIGLENIAKRLQILYPGAHTMEIIEDDLSYELRLTLILNP